MGTRGAYGFYKKGENKISYNHYDSYPSFLGNEVIDFIKCTTDEEMNDIFNKIKLVDERDKPTEEQKEKCKKWLDLTVSQQSDDDWYCLLRNAQGDLNAYKNGLEYMIGGYEIFIKNSLFCEYAYIINLDENCLEFYVGGQKRNTNNRYKLTKEEKKTAIKENCGYCNCKLVKTYPLDIVRKFPKNTLNDLEKVCGGDV